jgi:small subunit ribosomal protein S20|tara:strand:- start:18105 stop:18395 length:291 start_codon:yes stop_codon:yes gene_type:complete
MANIKSAIKRIDVTKRNTFRNKQYSSNIKTFTKKYLLSLQQYTNIPNDLNLNLVKDNLSSVYSKIDKATKANVLHKNTAARKKSALRIAFNSAKSK